MRNIKIEAGAGSHIDKVLQNAKALSVEKGVNVEFDFNGILCVVNEGTNREHLLRDYGNAHLMKWETVGPECEEVYSKDVHKSLEIAMAEQAEREKQRQAEYDAKQAKRLADYVTETAGIEMAYVDKQVFDDWHGKNLDGYGNAVFVYAMQWAKLMQARMKDGLRVKDVAKKASNDADTVGLSGAQYGMAVSLLTQTWVHGEQLYDWNKLPYDKQ